LFFEELVTAFERFRVAIRKVAGNISLYAAATGLHCPMRIIVPMQYSMTV